MTRSQRLLWVQRTRFVVSILLVFAGVTLSFPFFCFVLIYVNLFFQSFALARAERLLSE